jgi:hypothetical protein
VDFLHGLYQRISPLLELDPCFNSVLREKTAEALVREPTRFWDFGFDEVSEDEVAGSQSGGTARQDDLTPNGPHLSNENEGRENDFTF